MSFFSARSTRRGVWRLLALLFAFALVAAACGDDDDSDVDTGDGGDDTTEDSGDDMSDGEDGEDGGEATGLLAELQEEGSITIGIANEIPYGFEDEDGNVTGEAPEVAKIVLGELGVDNVEAQVVDFGSLISGLRSGQFDMIAAGMYINAERAEQILFSDPDYCVGEAFAVEEGNPLGLTDFQSVVDNPDATIAILSGAVEEGYAANVGVPTDQIELFADVNAQYDALEAGRVDAVTGTYLTVKEKADALDGFEVTEPFTPVDEEGEDILGCGGYGFRFENQDFRDAFNDKLNELQDAGELVDVITGFGFAEEDVLLAESLTVEDLTG